MTDPSKRYWITEQGMKEAAQKISGWYADRSRSGVPEMTIKGIAKVIAAHSEAASPPAGPLCDNCGKTSREHYCWLHLPHYEQDFYVPSEKRRAAAPPQGTPAPEPGMCEKCGKPNLNLGVTLCTAMLRDPRYAESFCFCTTVLPGHSTVAMQK